jgi:hypothetical protein
MDNPIRYALGAIVSAVVIAGIIAGGYFAGWWLAEDSVQRQTEIFNKSLAKQSADADAVLDQMTAIADIDVQLAGDVSSEQRAPLVAQRKALVTKMCVTADGVTVLSSSAEAFVKKEC